jgi:hypothetical protein
VAAARSRGAPSGESRERRRVGGGRRRAFRFGRERRHSTAGVRPGAVRRAAQRRSDALSRTAVERDGERPGRVAAARRPAAAASRDADRLQGLLAHFAPELAPSATTEPPAPSPSPAASK